MKEKIRLNTTRVVFTFRLNATLNNKGRIYFEISRWIFVYLKREKHIDFYNTFLYNLNWYIEIPGVIVGTNNSYNLKGRENL